MSNPPDRAGNPARRFRGGPSGPLPIPANRPASPFGLHKPRPELNTPLASNYKAPDYKENAYITWKEKNALPIGWDD